MNFCSYQKRTIEVTFFPVANGMVKMVERWEATASHPANARAHTITEQHARAEIAELIECGYIETTHTYEAR